MSRCCASEWIVPPVIAPLYLLLLLAYHLLTIPQTKQKLLMLLKQSHNPHHEYFVLSQTEN